MGKIRDVDFFFTNDLKIQRRLRQWPKNDTVFILYSPLYEKVRLTSKQMHE